MTSKTKIKAAKIRIWLKSYIENYVTMERCGHLFDRHINMSDKALMRRCIKEKVDASTFVGSAEEIVELIKNALTREEALESISYFLADEEERDEVWLEYDFLPDSVKGIMYLCGNGHNWDDGPIQCDEFCVVLARNPRKEVNGFIIKTAYPAIPE